MVWSISLDRTWSRCQKQYFFQYKMASSTASDEQRNRAQFLKELMSPELWQGKLVHKVIETIILPAVKSRFWPNPEMVVSEAVALAERQFAFSLNKTYESVPKKEAKGDYCVLTPHFFGTSDDREIFDEVIDVVSNALRNLLISEQMRSFLMGRPQYRIEKTHYFKVGNTQVQAIPDLIMLNKLRGGFDIIDWKVATTSGHYDFQVGVYALSIKATDWLFEKAPGEIHGYVINLLESEPAIALADPYKVNDEVLSSIIDIAYEKIERIEALVKGRKWQELNIDDFMFARSIGTCALCNWKSMCVEMSNGSPAKFLPDSQPRPTQLTLPFD
ncbi:MAG: PD-(D/E)XK nuclease family protein [Anaerolineae bacterium]|nr:PD-(D/E)XK nuclease family protein [Anaerolineae bacterium]